MAQQVLSCSICVDLLKDPVTIACGHSYCMSCIQTFWDTEEERRIYSCPECRRTFSPRPVLEKNIMLAGLVEELKKTELQATPVDQCSAGPEDVACDVCTGRKLKALKSCLVCLVSYCEEHLQPHYEAPPFKKHKLVAPTKKLQEKICPHHDEVMKMFCRTDQQCICYLCSVDQHKDHDMVTAAAARTERQRELELSREEIQQRIKAREKDVKELQQQVEAVNCSAEKAVQENEKIFTELMSLIQKRRSDVRQQIRSHQEAEVSRVKELQEKLEQEITELKTRDTELQQLLLTEDHNQFLDKFSSLTPLSPSTHTSSINTPPLTYFKAVTAAVSKVRGQVQDILSKTWRDISVRVTDVDGLSSQTEPRTRTELLQYSQEVTLDPNTTNTRLLLSEGNRRVTTMTQPLSYPPHPDRFTHWCQVLSTEGLTGRCYWEVEWRGTEVDVAVAYKNIRREGISYECGFGFNDESWCLSCRQNSYVFRHNSIITPVSGCVSSRVGVYLDHPAGVLSFYSISDTMTLLHRVQTTFTQPLHAGLCLYQPLGGPSARYSVDDHFTEGTAEICKLN